MTKTAIITGITGQDGAHLAELLLAKGYNVYGTFRHTSSVNFWRIPELGIEHHANLHLVEHDLTDFPAGIRLMDKAQPDEVYNLAAQSFVAVSFDQPMTSYAFVENLSILDALMWNTGDTVAAALHDNVNVA